LFAGDFRGKGLIEPVIRRKWPTSTSQWRKKEKERGGCLISQGSETQFDEAIRTTKEKILRFRVEVEEGKHKIAIDRHDGRTKLHSGGGRNGLAG